MPDLRSHKHATVAGAAWPCTIVACSLLMLTCVTRAQVPSPPASNADGATLSAPSSTTDPSTRQGFQFVWENDAFVGRATDRWYTNGLHLASAWRRGEEPRTFRPLKERLEHLLLPDDCSSRPITDLACGVTLTWAVGQNMYTPRRIRLAEPQLRDRPWAGWLYGGLGLSNYDGERHQSLAIKAGPTGRASLAEPVQTEFHRWIGSPKPAGWDNQLTSRLGVQVSYMSTHRMVVGPGLGVHLSWGGTVGNLRTQARVAAAGYWSPVGDLVRRHQPGTLDEGDFMVPDFNGRVSGEGLWSSLRHVVFYGHVQFAGVARNAFLEGHTAAGRHQIDRIPGVVTTTVGFTVPLGGQDGWKVGYAVKRRTPEFKVRDETTRDTYARWGVLTFARDFHAD